MKKAQVQPLIGIMVALIIGIGVAVPVIIDQVNQATSSADITNEAMTCTNATTQTLANDNLLSGTFTLQNDTGGIVIGSGNYTLTIATGSVLFTTLNNTLYPADVCVANYTYYPDAYQTSATSRTLTGVLPLLFVVSLVLIVVAWMKLK